MTLIHIPCIGTQLSTSIYIQLQEQRELCDLGPGLASLNGRQEFTPFTLPLLRPVGFASTALLTTVPSQYQQTLHPYIYLLII